MNSSEQIVNVLKLSQVALKSGDIVEKSGIGKIEVDKIIKILMSDGLIISPKRCFYQLKA